MWSKAWPKFATCNERQLTVVSRRQQVKVMSRHVIYFCNAYINVFLACLLISFSNFKYNLTWWQTYNSQSILLLSETQVVPLQTPNLKYSNCCKCEISLNNHLTILFLVCQSYCDRRWESTWRASHEGMIQRPPHKIHSWHNGYLIYFIIAE